MACEGKRCRSARRDFKALRCQRQESEQRPTAARAEVEDVLTRNLLVEAAEETVDEEVQSSTNVFVLLSFELECTLKGVNRS